MHSYGNHYSMYISAGFKLNLHNALSLSFIYISHSDSRSTVVLQSEILETMYVSYAHKVHNKSVEKIDA